MATQTGRVFGSIASIVTERKNIHHSIHRGLESTDNVEVDAAIYATGCLCKHSRTFAAGVCDKITSMVQGLTTPISMKLRLFPILTFMQHDISTATQVRELCVKLLPAYPSLSFVTVILHTLTQLSVATLTHIPDQVKLLLYYASGDARLQVRLKAYGHLLQIANKVPHSWTEEMIKGFFTVMEKASDKEKMVGVKVLYQLASSLAVHNMTFLKSDESFLALCYSPSATISAYCMGVATNVVMETAKGDSDEEKRKDEMEEIGSLVVEAFLLMEHSSDSMASFKVLLSSLVLLASHSSVSMSALDALLGILPSLSGSQAVMVCQTLASIAVHTPGMWNHVSPKLLDYLDSKQEDSHELLLPVSAVVMQLHQGDSGSTERQFFHQNVLPSLLNRVWELKHPSRFWVAYKVARKASMMGFHDLAESVYFKLSRTVTTVKFRYWLNALYQFSLSQSLLSAASVPEGDSPASPSDLLPSLSKAAAIVYNSMMLMKASSPSSSFPYEFLNVHTSWLNAYHQLLATCVSYYTLPPPTTSLGHSLERKLRMCVVQFQTVSEQYSDLYSSLFDADLATLEYISLMQQSCLLMASVISSIGLSRRPLVSPGRVSTPLSDAPVGQLEVSDNFNTSFLLGKACRAILHHSQIMSSTLQSLPFGEEHATALLDCCRMILQVPIQLPKHFFTSIQVTNVKLALSPPIPPPGQHVSLSPNTHLTLKVEGVVEHSICRNNKLHRTPTAVYVQVQPKLEKPFASDAKSPELSMLEKTEPIEKDYFQSQFLLALPTPGYYSVHIEARLLDQEGRVWHLGHKARMVVVVDSDENVKMQQKQRDSAQQSTSSGGGSSAKGSGVGTGSHGRN